MLSLKGEEKPERGEKKDTYRLIEAELQRLRAFIPNTRDLELKAEGCFGKQDFR